MRIELAVANPRAAKGGRKPFSWQGPPEIQVEIRSLAPLHLILNAGGRHVLEQDGKSIAASLGKASIGPTEGAFGPETLHAEIEDAAAEGIWTEPLLLGRLDLDLARRFDMAPDDLQAPSASLSLGLEQLTLPPEVNPFLNSAVTRLSARLTLKGPFPEALKAEPLRAWSEAGGILDVLNFHLDWAPLTLDGDGALALDGYLLPIAPFGLRAKGVFEAVDALEGRGLVPPENALLVKMALAVLAQEPPDPATGLMRLPLTLQGRDLFLGAARIHRLPMPPWVEE